MPHEVAAPSQSFLQRFMSQKKAGAGNVSPKKPKKPEEKKPGLIETFTELRKKWDQFKGIGAKKGNAR